MCIMRFIHLVNQNMSRLFYQRVQVIGSGFFPALSCLVHNKNTMCPLRNIQCQKTVFHIHILCNIHKRIRFQRIIFFRPLIQTLCHVYAQYFFTFIRPLPRTAFQEAEINPCPFHRPLHIIAAHIQIPFQILRIILFNPAIGKPRREMGIIQNPKFHIKFFRFFQEKIHIFPPAIRYELRMGPCFNTYTFYPDGRNFLHILAKHAVGFPMLPEKWIQHVRRIFSSERFKSFHRKNLLHKILMLFSLHPQI